MAITKGAFSCRRCHPTCRPEPVLAAQGLDRASRRSLGVGDQPAIRGAARKIYCHSTWNRSSAPWSMAAPPQSCTRCLGQRVQRDCAQRMVAAGLLSSLRPKDDLQSPYLEMRMSFFALGPTSIDRFRESVNSRESGSSCSCSRSNSGRGDRSNSSRGERRNTRSREHNSFRSRSQCRDSQVCV
jgi:hypothetical protein